MAEISQQSLQALLGALMGERQSHVETGAHRFEPGGVWHGDWWRNADKGKFGETKKHNACVVESVQEAYFRMAPITSQRHKRAVRLPAGEIPGGKLTVSYMLRTHLRARKSTLQTQFEYKTTLTEHYLRDWEDSVK